MSNFNQDNVSTALLGPETGTTLADFNATAMVGKKSTLSKAAKPAPQRGKVAPTRTEGAPAVAPPAPATPARLGRPPLSEDEKLERKEQHENQRAVMGIVKSSTARQAKAAKTAKKGASKPKADEGEAGSPSTSGSGLGVAQRLLGVDYGESQEPSEDLAPRPAQRLPENVKKFIVIRNACGQTPREVIRDVFEAFGLKLTSSQIARYDPTKAAGQTLRFELKRLFAEMRREHHFIINTLGVGCQGTRIVMLHNMCEAAVEQGNGKLAARLLDQVARKV